MVLIHHRLYSSLILCCVTMHLWWALMLIVDAPAAVAATPLAELDHLVAHPALLGLLLVLASVSAILGTRAERWSFWLLVPQQVLLMTSAFGAVTAMCLSQYADGVLRPRAFISTDQAWVVAAAVWHTIAILAHARGATEREATRGSV